MMNLSTLNTVVSALTAIEFEGKDAVMESLQKEIDLAVAADARKVEQKSAKVAEYAEAHDAVMEVLSRESQPLTVSEIWGEIEGKVEGFTKGKLSYALSRLWVDEVVKTEGKVNAYTVKA